MKVTGPHFHSSLQIGPDDTAVLGHLSTSRLLDQAPQHGHMLSCQKLLVFHQVQCRHFGIGGDQHPNLIRLLLLQPPLVQAGGQNIFVVCRTHLVEPRASPASSFRSIATNHFPCPFKESVDNLNP